MNPTIQGITLGHKAPVPAFTGNAYTRLPNAGFDSLDLRFAGEKREYILPQHRVEVLWGSAGEGNVETLKDLLVFVKQGKFDLNQTNHQGATPAHFAAQAGAVEWLKLAHEEGNLDLTIPDKDGETPIDWARKYPDEGADTAPAVAYLEEEMAKGTAAAKKKTPRRKLWVKLGQALLWPLRKAWELLQAAVSWLTGSKPSSKE